MNQHDGYSVNSSLDPGEDLATGETFAFFRSPRCHDSSPQTNRGFALVVTLSLMILLTVIAIGLLSLSSISLRSSTQEEAMATARANARMGLMLAIGELQKEAGPDQRITARAEILDSKPDTPAVEGVNQKYWTGVWKTGSKPTEAQRTDSIGTSRTLAARWLVSNPQPGSQNPLDPIGYTAISNNTDADGVVIAKNLGADLAEVTVPLVKVPGSTISTPGGRYGYWVCDEGLKAKANLVDFTFSSGLAAIDQLHHLAPQANAMQKVLPMASTGLDLRKSPPETMAKFLTLETVKLLPEVSMKNPIARYSPDFTVNSQGVIADVRHGGLKKDLTAAFETPSAFESLLNNYGNGAAMLYRYSTNSANTDPTIPSGVQPANPEITDGLPWHSLYFHYNTYKSLMSSPIASSGKPSTAPTSSGTPETLPNVLSPRYYGVKLAGSSTKQAGIAPMPIAFRVDVAISSYNAGNATTPAWRLRLHYYPQLVLYNPYSARIQASDYQFQRNFGAFATAGSYNAASPTVTCIKVSAKSGNTTITVPYSLINQADAGRLTLKTKAGACATLEPGETRVFALDADELKSDPKAAITFSDLVSNPGMSADYSQYCDLPATADATTGKSSGTPFSTTDPNAEISIQLSAPSLRCQAVDTFCNPPNYKWPDNDGSARAQAGGSYQQPASAGSWQKLSISQMNSQPRRIIGFYIRQKGLKPSASTFTYSNAANQIPLFHGNFSQFTPLEDSASYPWKEVYLSPFGGIYTNGQTDVQIVHPAGNPNVWQTSFGDASAGSGMPSNRYILRDVPRQPLVSLGQFMHMPAMNFLTIGNFAYLGMGSMFVGGSLPSPVIPLDNNALTSPTVAGSVTSDTLFLDDSFLANQALFDRFFLSTVPPAAASSGTTLPAYWNDFNDANAGSVLIDFNKPLLNGRIKPRSPASKPLRMDELRSVEKAAANLILDGAFNVNSTSTGAWKALLGSLSGNKLRLFNATSGNATTLDLGTGPNKNPIPRFWSASANCNPNSAWDGLRVLNDAELDELAARIVEQVKLRGPFLSMADFLNRRLGPDGPLTRAGALQAAIDNTSPDVNATAKAAGVPTTVTGGTPAMIPGNLKDAKGNTLNTATGMPGYLMQQDIVQAFSPAMTVRSDTFTVRACGQAIDASGRVIAQVIAEAVVQRLPEFLDGSTDPAEASLADLKSEKNKIFGRSFTITSFRWLSPNEI